MYYLEWYDTKKNVGLGKIGVENNNLEEITEKAIEIYKGQCKADKEHIEVIIRDMKDEEFSESIGKNTFVLEKTLQYADLEDFKKSKEYGEIMTAGKIYQYDNFKEYVDIYVYAKIDENIDYLEELIYHFDGNDIEFNEIDANLFLNDISGATLKTENIEYIINEYKKLGE